MTHASLLSYILTILLHPILGILKKSPSFVESPSMNKLMDFLPLKSQSISFTVIDGLFKVRNFTMYVNPGLMDFLQVESPSISKLMDFLPKKSIS